MSSITIKSNNDPGFSQEVALAEKTTIGRDAKCNIFLPDPEKHISRLHAQIEHQAGSYMLTVASKTNPVMINDKAYPHGIAVKLNEGDRIIIQSYVLTVNALTQSAPISPASPLSPPSPWGNANSPSFGTAAHDPFGLDDLISKPVAKPDNGIDPFQTLASPTPGMQGSIQGRHGSGLVDGLAPLGSENHFKPQNNHLLDPMVALGQKGTSNPLGISGNSSSTSSSAFDDIFSSLPPSSQGKSSIATNKPSSPLVDLGGHHPTGTRSLEHVHDINRPFTPPPVMEAAAPKPGTLADALGNSSPRIDDPFIDDPFADALGSYIQKPSASPSQFAPAPAPAPATAPYQPPAAAVPLASDTIPAHTPAINANGQINLLLSAFRNAAGLSNQPITADEAIAFMASSGTIVRAAIEGITSLLASRSMLKGELGAEDRTMVASRDNNPLKLMPDINEVMQFLFENKILNSSAYLSPVQSIAGACEDLIYHEIGTTAGMRAAVEASIRRFNPQLIEKQFDKAGKKMVLNRKAALWETYEANYKKIEETMADDIGRLFERDFRLAYDSQIRKLKKK